MTLADLGDHLYVLWFTCSQLKKNIWIYNILTLSVQDEGYLRNTFVHTTLYLLFKQAQFTHAETTLVDLPVENLLTMKYNKASFFFISL
jgi:hypothetical protein